MGAALSAGGHRAKLKMNIMDTLGTMQPLPATINDEGYTAFPWTACNIQFY